ncbi:MAG: SsrA-binding protein, partial [Burkholderiaceae bacterium]|nr:SsrA-binding protein [Burkholderiaceae bacterium]
MSSKNKTAQAARDSRIADNKKASFNYHFEERYECGLVLEG